MEAFTTDRPLSIAITPVDDLLCCFIKFITIEALIYVDTDERVLFIEYEANSRKTVVASNSLNDFFVAIPSGRVVGFRGGAVWLKRYFVNVTNSLAIIY